MGRKVGGDVLLLEKHPFLPKMLCSIRRGEAVSGEPTRHIHTHLRLRETMLRILCTHLRRSRDPLSHPTAGLAPHLSALTSRPPLRLTPPALGLAAQRLAHRTTVHRPITARLLPCAAEPPRTRYHAWQNRAVPRAPRRTMRCEHDTPHAPRASPRRTSGRRRTD